MLQEPYLPLPPLSVPLPCQDLQINTSAGGLDVTLSKNLGTTASVIPITHPQFTTQLNSLGYIVLTISGHYPLPILMTTHVMVMLSPLRINTSHIQMKVLFCWVSGTGIKEL